MRSAEDRQAKLAPARGRVTPVKLAHFVLRTARLHELLRWYQTVLGATIVHSDDTIAFLSFDDEHHRVAIAAVPGLPDRPDFAAGTDHVAFTFADLGDLLHHYLRLKGEGIEPYWCINHGPTTSMYYRDPDGLRVELQIDNFATAEEGQAYLTGPDFADNPIGVIYDPEQLIRDFEAGLSMDELVRRPPLPAGKTPMDMRAERTGP
jgi:catechol 2,3-dioxygenase-like lactoylglutathione lyase family enzyme